MRKPAMILFDYARTLAWEPDADFLRGERAVFAHVKDNPRQVTPEEAARLARSCSCPPGTAATAAGSCTSTSISI